jgi:hypothetical protein
MKTFACSAILIFVFSLSAQAPASVPVAKEPHHHLVLTNGNMNAFRVSVPANDTTLMHRHDLSYVYVSLGPADIINAVEGKPEIHAKLVDGQVGYAKGGFAHIARTDFGIPFNNVTVELVGNQGEPHNLCEKVVAGDLGKCDLSRDEVTAAIRTKPVLETDGVLVEAVIAQRGEHMDVPLARAGLLIVVSGAPLKVAGVPGGNQETLHSGELIWLPARAQPKFIVEDGPESRLLLITFKEGAAKR